MRSLVIDSIIMCLTCEVTLLSLTQYVLEVVRDNQWTATSLAVLARGYHYINRGHAEPGYWSRILLMGPRCMYSLTWSSHWRGERGTWLFSGIPYGAEHSHHLHMIIYVHTYIHVRIVMCNNYPKTIHLIVSHSIAVYLSMCQHKHIWEACGRGTWKACGCGTWHGRHVGVAHGSG